MKENNRRRNDPVTFDDILSPDNIGQLFRKAKTPVEHVQLSKELHDLQVQRVKAKYGDDFDTVLGGTLQNPNQQGSAEANASKPTPVKGGFLETLFPGQKQKTEELPTRPVTSRTQGYEKTTVGKGMTGYKEITPSGGKLTDTRTEDLAVQQDTGEGLLSQLHRLFSGKGVAATKTGQVGVDAVQSAASGVNPAEVIGQGLMQLLPSPGSSTINASDMLQNLERNIKNIKNIKVGGKKLRDKTGEEKLAGLLNKPGMTKEMVRREITAAEQGTPVQIGNGQYILKDGKLVRVS